MTYSIFHIVLRYYVESKEKMSGYEIDRNISQARKRQQKVPNDRDPTDSPLSRDNDSARASRNGYKGFDFLVILVLGSFWLPTEKYYWNTERLAKKK